MSTLVKKVTEQKEKYSSLVTKAKESNILSPASTDPINNHNKDRGWDSGFNKTGK